MAWPEASEVINTGTGGGAGVYPSGNFTGVVGTAESADADDGWPPEPTAPVVAD